MTHYNVEEFAQKLDQIFPPGKRSVRERGRFDDPLLYTAAILTRTEAPALSPQASARIQAAVVRAHKARFARRRAAQRSRFWGWAAAAAVLIAVMVGGVVPAAANSVPGEVFYPVKQTIERIEMALAASPDARVGTLLQHAERRVSEAEILNARGQEITGLAAAVESSLEAAVLAAGDDAALMGFTMQRASEIEQRLALLKNAVLPIPSTPTPTPSVTPTPSSTPSATPNETEDAFVTTPEIAAPTTIPASATPIRANQPPVNQPPVQQPPVNPPQMDQTGNCEDRGNSCDSEGVPGGQIDPANPPGQDGGRADENPGQGGGGGNGNGRGNN